MSGKLEKLEEFSRAWIDADNNYAADVAAAAGDTKLIHEIDTNWWMHQANWSMAATAALAKSNDQIETLLKSARDANDQITKAREKAEGIVKVVKASAKVANSLAELLKAVA